MKVILSLMSAVLLTLTLSACGDRPENKVDKNADNAMESNEKLNNAAGTSQEKLKEGEGDAPAQPTAPQNPAQ